VSWIVLVLEEAGLLSDTTAVLRDRIKWTPCAWAKVAMKLHIKQSALPLMNIVTLFVIMLLFVCVINSNVLWNSITFRVALCTAVDIRKVHTYLRTYVCMYVCMYVCTYVCVYLCMYVSMYVYMYFFFIYLLSMLHYLCNITCCCYLHCTLYTE